MYLSRDIVRHIAAFVLACVATVALRVALYGCPGIYDTSGMLYVCIIIAWALTVRRRVTQRSIQRYLVAAAAFLVVFFILRMCRYDFFVHSVEAVRRLAQWYYIPMSAVPLLTFGVALRIGLLPAAGKHQYSSHCNRRGASMLEGALWALWLLLAVGVVTNDVHQGLFYYYAGLEAADTYTRGWLYAVVTSWCVLLTAASLVVMVRRCQLTSVRRLWYVPPLAMALPVALLVWYTVCGGSPEVFGTKPYNLQEVYALLYIAFWESCIQIGLIPSNSGFEELFEQSNGGAVLMERTGEPAYRSAQATGNRIAQMRTMNPGDVVLDGDQRFQCADVSGGCICWVDDLSAVNRLNDQLAEALQRISENNTLLEEENLIKEEQARYQTQNVLYDKIAFELHPQLAELDGLLATMDDEAGDFDAALRRSVVLGAYVKRRANMMLLADGAECLNSMELVLAIRESVEYLMLAGVACAVTDRRKGDVAPEELLLAYDVFEAAVEAALPELNALMVSLDTEGGLSLNLVMDGAAGMIEPQRRREFIGQGNIQNDSAGSGIRSIFQDAVAETALTHILFQCHYNFMIRKHFPQHLFIDRLHAAHVDQ